MAANHARLDSLDNVLAQSKKSNANLRAQVKKLQAQLEEKEEMIANLQGQIAEKDGQIANLNTQVDNLNSDLNNANNQIESLTNANMMQVNEMNAVYYIGASKKDLKAKGIMSNLKNVLKQEVPTEEFTRADKRELKTITFNAKKAVVISSHPVGSYSIENVDKTTVQIVITNPEAFWSVTKYLVAITK